MAKGFECDKCKSLFSGNHRSMMSKEVKYGKMSPWDSRFDVKVEICNVNANGGSRRAELCPKCLAQVVIDAIGSWIGSEVEYTGEEQNDRTSQNPEVT